MISCSGGVALYHLDRHDCRSTGSYGVDVLECEYHGTFARLVRCELCGNPLLLRVEGDACECVPSLLDELNLEVAA